MLECVANISEGRDPRLLSAFASAAGPDLLDLHADVDHNRSVFTMVGIESVRSLASQAVSDLDVHRHSGVHPRLGVIDVVPFVPLFGSTMQDALMARNDFGQWIVDTHRVPVFFYGPKPSIDRQLPDIRREAWKTIGPDLGPKAPHPTAGAVCVGARSTLIAYNVWLDSLLDESDARRLRDAVRGDGIRVLTLVIDGRTQVSMNLIEPHRIGPDDAYARVESVAGQFGAGVERAELVGLMENSVLEKIPKERWPLLDVDQERTIEARLARR
ncbi:MAG: hypothetical protein RL391_1630 [Actinomycetota bacterium]